MHAASKVPPLPASPEKVEPGLNCVLQVADGVMGGVVALVFGEQTVG